MFSKSAVLHTFSQRHLFGVCSLLGCWTVGLLLGFFVTFFVDRTAIYVALGSCSSPVSVLDLLIGAFFPFLLSALAVYVNEFWLLGPILFSKAFALSFCAFLISCISGDAGWLMCTLTLFSGWLCSSPLLHFTLLALYDRTKALNRFPWFLVSHIIFILIDLFYIAPLLSSALAG